MNTLLVVAFLLCTLATQWAHGQYNNTCVLQPSTPSCTTYKLPESIVEGDVDHLCLQMDNMPGCGLRKLCAEGDYQQSPYCGEFNVYKVICIDMPGMTGCKDYNSMCGNTSVVQQCDEEALSLPSTMDASHLIVSMCTSMTMSACSKCPGSTDSNSKMLNCDLLAVYSELCLSMPDMQECKAWKSFCKDIPEWSLCDTNNPDSPPEMRMYFHTGEKDYVLFYGWVPRTTGQYVGTWFAVFVFCVLFEAFKCGRNLLEKKWREQGTKTLSYHFSAPVHSSSEDDQAACSHCQDKSTPTVPAVSQDSRTHAPFAPFRVKVDVVRGFLHLIEVGWGLLIMLIAMTYNLGLFLAVCVGAGVGMVAFGRFMAYEPKASCH